MKRALSFVSGLMLVLLAVLSSVAVPALSTARFEGAVLNTVNREAVGMSESDLTAFARETMQYLRGEKDTWQPHTPFAIPDSFRAHMAEVRIWVDALKIILPLCAALAIAALWLGRDGRMVRAGVLCMLGLIAVVLLWAVVDFDSLWMVIHRVFIPGGIFAAGEPIMMLFSLELFFGYVPAVAGWLAGWLAILYAVSRFLKRKKAA